MPSVNLQNIPIRSKRGAQVRGAFIAPDGCLVMAGDYAQIEVRVLAAVSQDEEMIQVIKSGEDVHKVTASLAFGIPVSEVTKKQRSPAKNITFAKLYGAGFHKLAEMLLAEVSPLEICNMMGWDELPPNGYLLAAKRFYSAFASKYPAADKYTRDAIESARRLGYAQTLYGRRLALPGLNHKDKTIREGALKVAVNMPIQGTAADIMKMAMVAVFHELRRLHLRSRILIQVHDEIVLEVPIDELAITASVVRSKMIRSADLPVPIDVDIEVGESWGSVKEYKLAA